MYGRTRYGGYGGDIDDFSAQRKNSVPSVLLGRGLFMRTRARSVSQKQRSYSYCTTINLIFLNALTWWSYSFLSNSILLAPLRKHSYTWWSYLFLSNSTLLASLKKNSYIFYSNKYYYPQLEEHGPKHVLRPFLRALLALVVPSGSQEKEEPQKIQKERRCIFFFSLFAPRFTMFSFLFCRRRRWLFCCSR